MKLAVIGGCVAGMSAALYALRAGVEVDVFEQLGLMGGVVATLNEIENYPGTGKINGFVNSFTAITNNSNRFVAIEISVTRCAIGHTFANKTLFNPQAFSNCSGC